MPSVLGVVGWREFRLSYMPHHNILLRQHILSFSPSTYTCCTVDSSLVNNRWYGMPTCNLPVAGDSCPGEMLANYRGGQLNHDSIPGDSIVMPAVVTNSNKHQGSSPACRFSTVFFHVQIPLLPLEHSYICLQFL